MTDEGVVVHLTEEEAAVAEHMALYAAMKMMGIGSGGLGWKFLQIHGKLAQAHEDALAGDETQEVG